MASELGHKVTTGAIWSSIDRFGNLGLQFIVNLVLARILTPRDFGLIGMLTIFLMVSQVLVDGGFGSALIQKRQPTQTDYSTIFFWNVGFSSFLYLILYISAPWIAGFYHTPLLKEVLRVVGLSLITSSIYTIQIAKLKKSLAFKLLSITNLSAYVCGALLGIVMAFDGYGVWSLVGMQLAYSIAGIVMLFIITKWYPSLEFSRTTMKELFGFGGYIMAANMLETISRNVQGLIIGRKFSASQMGYYSQASKFNRISSETFPQVIGQVLYPTFSSIQNDSNRMIGVLSRSIRIIAFVTFPIIGFLIIVAEPLINILYGAKWYPSIPYYQIFCVGGIFACLINVNFYAVAALGHSKLLFKWSIYKWSFLLCAIMVGMKFGIEGIIWGVVCANFNTYIVNAILACKKLNWSIWKQIWEWGFILILVVISFIIGLAVAGWIGLGKWETGGLYLVCYICLSYLFNRNDFIEMKNLWRMLKTKI